MTYMDHIKITNHKKPTNRVKMLHAKRETWQKLETKSIIQKQQNDPINKSREYKSEGFGL